MTPSVPTRRASDLDIELDGDAGELLQPVFGDHAGVEAGAAGDDGDARHVGEGKVHLRQRDLLLQRAEIGFERLRDDDRLLENLLLHEVAVVALLDCRGARERSEEHTSELKALMRISYAVFCLTKKNINTTTHRK